MAAPADTGAAESAPRACDEMNFKVIARSMDSASDFATRLTLLGKPLAHERALQPAADKEDGTTVSNMEEINVGTLRNALGEVWGYLAAAENLAAARDLMADERDRGVLDRQLKLVAQQIQEPLSFGLEIAENVSAGTTHPPIAAEVAKIHDFMDRTRTQFAACAGRGNP